MKTIDVEIMDIDVKTIILKQEFEVQNTQEKIVNNKYELKITLEDKVYLKMYYNYQLKSVVVNETLTKVKAQELQQGLGC